jgi:hypothetical protein
MIIIGTILYLSLVALILMFFMGAYFPDDEV